MNQARSDEAWWRYALLWCLTVVLVMACQNWQKQEEPDVGNRPSFPLTNPTRVRVDQIESNVTWGRLLTYHQKKSMGKDQPVLEAGAPFIIELKEGILTLKDLYMPQTVLYINGKEASLELLAKLKIDYIEELFVLHQFEGVDDYDPKPYRVLIQIRDTPMATLPGRNELVAMLEAAAISEHPLGTSHSYTMNKVLEATFFGYRDVFVKRMKNQHLKIQDEFIHDIDVFINKIPVDPREVETVHVREIAQLQTYEKPYTAWRGTGKRSNRYMLLIQTAPKRAKRDSSYYVFSPFYSGDF